MVCLRLFGGCSVASDGDTLSGPAVQHRRLALLALLAGNRSLGLSRDKLTAYFWPEEDRDRARHFLADSVFTIRRSLGKDALLTVGAVVRLNPEVFRTDLWLFEDASARGDCESAAEMYEGPFLDGFFISDAPEFERWVAVERERLAKQYADCLERLANHYESAQDFRKAAIWLDRLSVHDPYSARIALRLMDALSRSGDAAAALRHAANYEKQIRSDLELAPDSAVLALARRLRCSPVETAGPVSVVGAPSERTTSARDHSSHEEPSSPASPAELATFKPSHAPASNPRPISRARHVGIAGLVIITAAVIEPGARYIARSGTSSANSVGHQNVSTARDWNPPRSARQEAEELYHRGRLALKLPDEKGHGAEAISLFKMAIDRDPTFALPYAGLADAYDAVGDPHHAKEAALKALALDSSLAEAHASLAYELGFFEHQWEAADSAITRAIKLSPQFALGHMRRAYICAAMGRADEAVACAEHARAIDPESWMVLYNRGLIAFAVNRPRDAIPLYEAALALEPDHAEARIHLAWAYKATGQNEAALALVRTLGSSTAAIVFGGDEQGMKALLDKFENDSLQIEPAHAGIMYAWLGNNDGAFRELRRSITTDRFLPLHMRQVPVVRLKDDPRYGRLMADLGLSQSNNR